MTTHQLYLRHSAALGIDSYNTFCKLLELLDAPANVESCIKGRWFVVSYPSASVARCIRYCYAAQNEDKRIGEQTSRRVVLLDGTVIREWPTDEYDGIF